MPIYKDYLNHTFDLTFSTLGLVSYVFLPFTKVMHEDKTSHIHGTGNRFIPALAPGTGEPGLYTHGSGGLHQAKTLLTSRSDF